MKRPELRPYQAEAGAKVNAAIAAGYRRVLMVAPTGSGKTVIAAAMIDQAAAAGREVLVVAHRREIVAQTVAKLADAGIEAGIIQAGVEPRPELLVQVASIQTLHARAIRGSRFAGFSPRYARACELRWQTMAEEVIEIADKQDFVERPDIANAMVQQQRLAVDARKWLLSKMAPRKYGDRVEVAGSPDAPIIRRIELIAVYPRIEPPTIDVEPDNGPDA